MADFVSFTGVKPVASTETDLYTCPGAKAAFVITLRALNQGGAAGTWSAWKQAAAGAGVDANKIIEDLSIASKETQEFTKIVMAAGERLIVVSSNGDVVFSGGAVEFDQ